MSFSHFRLAFRPFIRGQQPEAISLLQPPPQSLQLERHRGVPAPFVVLSANLPLINMIGVRTVLAPFKRRVLCASPLSAAACRRNVSFYNPSLAGLTEEQAELREAVASWAQKEVAPRAHEIDKENKSPMDLWPKLGEMGLLGITVPEEDGGLGRGYLEHTIVMEGEASSLMGKTCFRSCADAVHLIRKSFPGLRDHLRCRMELIQTSA